MTSPRLFWVCLCSCISFSGQHCQLWRVPLFLPYWRLWATSACWEQYVPPLRPTPVPENLSDWSCLGPVPVLAPITGWGGGALALAILITCAVPRENSHSGSCSSEKQTLERHLGIFFTKEHWSYLFLCLFILQSEGHWLCVNNSTSLRTP